MGQIIWGMWARYMGGCASVCLILGGAEAFIYPSVPRAIASILAGVLVAILELPMPGVEQLAPVATSYHLRAVLYLVGAIPFLFDVPTTTGALCLALTGVIYAVGAIRKEKWSHPREWLKPGGSKTRTISGGASLKQIAVVERGGNAEMRMKQAHGLSPEKNTRQDVPAAVTHMPFSSSTNSRENVRLAHAQSPLHVQARQVQSPVHTHVHDRRSPTSSHRVDAHSLRRQQPPVHRQPVPPRHAYRHSDAQSHMSSESMAMSAQDFARAKAMHTNRDRSHQQRAHAHHSATNKRSADDMRSPRLDHVHRMPSTMDSRRENGRR